MSKSGMAASQELKNAFKKMKIAKQPHSFMTCLADEKVGEIVLVKDGNCSGKEGLVKHLPKDVCLHVIYDNGAKLTYLMWCPDESPVRSRMVTSSSKEAIFSACEGISFNYEVHSHDDVLDKLSKQK